ncbi:MAG: hypothetical protein Q8876_03525 [Bacillota bacterium]|nr:hypothetical protein [Bacillota bacterium]
MTLNKSSDKEIKHGITKKEFIVFFIMLSVLWMILQTANFQINPCYKNDNFRDTDSFMRMVRVDELHGTNNWYDSTIMRSDAPVGETLHWSRPLDVMLLVGADVLSPFVGFNRGLEYWAFVMNTLLGIFALAAACWALKPYFSRMSRFFAAVILTLSFGFFGMFVLGDPDHHSLLLTLFILQIGILFRMLKKEYPEYYSIVGGVISGLAIWVSIESMVTVALIFACIGLAWIVYGRFYLNRLRKYSLTLLVSIIVSIALERTPSSWLVWEYDKISAVHAILFFVVFAVISLMYVCNKYCNTLLKRILNTICGLFTLIIVLILWVPKLFHGPFVDVNPAIIPIWLDKIIEMQPLYKQGFQYMLSVTATILFAAASAVIWFVGGHFKQSTEKSELNPFFVFIIGFFVFFTLTVFQIRWNGYMFLILYLMTAVGVAIVTEKVSKIQLKAVRTLLNAAVLVSVILIPVACSAIPISNTTVSNDSIDYPTRDLCAWIKNNPNIFKSGDIIDTEVNYSPEILYRTNLSVIATPYQRNADGILYHYNLMNLKDDNQIKHMLKERNVKWILVAKPAAKYTGKSCFYSELLNNKTPSFIKETVISDKLKKYFLVYKVGSSMINNER